MSSTRNITSLSLSLLGTVHNTLERPPFLFLHLFADSGPIWRCESVVTFQILLQRRLMNNSKTLKSQQNPWQDVVITNCCGYS